MILLVLRVLTRVEHSPLRILALLQYASNMVLCTPGTVRNVLYMEVTVNNSKSLVYSCEIFFFRTYEWIGKYSWLVFSAGNTRGVVDCG